MPGQDPRAALNRHLEQAQAHLESERYGLVVDQLRRAIDIHPEIPGAYYQLGLAHWHLRDLDEARRAFLRELEFDPPDAYSLYYLGRIELSDGNTAEAVGCFERVLSVGTILDVRARLASGYLRMGRVAEAVELLEETVGKWPEKGETHYLLGQAYRRQGRDSEARHEFDLAERWKRKLQGEIEGLVGLRVLLQKGNLVGARARARDLAGSGDPDVMLAAATALGRSGLHGDAVPVLRQVLDLRPGSAEAHYNMALAHASLDRSTDAVPHLRQAVALRPEFYEPRMMLGNVLAQAGDCEGAIPHLRVAAAVRKDSAKLAAFLGLQYLQCRYYREAIGSFRRAVELDPANADLRFLLVDAHFRNHDFERALEEARAARDRFPDIANSHYQIAWQLENMGRFEESRAHLERAVSIDSGLADAHRMLGAVALRLGEAEASVGHFRRALALDPGLPQASAGLGQALIRLRKYDEAVAEMEAAIKVLPGQGPLHLYLSQAYRATGRIDDARREAATATRLNRERARERDRDVEREYAPPRSDVGL